MTDDQMYIPEDVRPFGTAKNPYASSTKWKPQEDLIEEEEMRDPNWYPKNTHYNVYNKPDFQRSAETKALRENSSGW